MDGRQNRVRVALDSFLDRALGRRGWDGLGDSVGRFQQPATDIYETKDTVVAELEMPGVDPRQIRIDVSNTTIRVKARVKPARRGMRRHERSHAGFYRELSFTTPVRGALVEYQDGILRIRIPKRTVIKA